MPISVRADGVTTNFVVLAGGVTVAEVYRALAARRAEGVTSSTWIVVPVFAGLIITRIGELERLADLLRSDLAGLSVADLGRVQIPADPADGAAPPALSRRDREQIALVLAALRPAPVLDAGATIQRAIELRDSHPGRRLGILEGSRVARLFVAESDQAVVSKGVDGPPPAKHSRQAVLTSPEPHSETVWQPRRMEAATTRVTRVGDVLLLWVRVALATSPGLLEVLASEGLVADGAGVGKSDPSEVSYASGAEEMAIAFDVTATDFRMAQSSYTLQVRRARDSARIDVQLVPTQARERSPIRVDFYQGRGQRGVCASVTLYVEVAAAEALQPRDMIQGGYASVTPVQLSGAIVVINNGTYVGTITDSSAISVGPSASTTTYGS